MRESTSIARIVGAAACGIALIALSGCDPTPKGPPTPKAASTQPTPEAIAALRMRSIISSPSG